MAKFRQKVLQPGHFRVDGELRELSKDDLREYVNGTNAALSANLACPVFKQHTPIGSDDGGLVQFDDRPALPQAKDGVGWVEGAEINEAGEVFLAFSIPDKDQAKRIRSGTDRFTSPEMRDSHVDGLNRKHGKHFAHLALTPRPRNPNQGPIVEQFAMQFSLDDLVTAKGNPMKPKNTKVQFVDDDVDADADAADGGDTMTAKMNQLKTLLNEIGIDITADAGDPASVLDQVLGALSALKASGDLPEANENPQDRPEDKDKIEEVPPAVAQFSEAYTKKIKALEAQLQGQVNARGRDQVRVLIENSKLGKGLKDKLLTPLSGIQFSQDGKSGEGISPKQWTTAEVVEMIEDGLPENMRFDEDGEIVSHPSGSDFFRDGLEGGAAAQNDAEATATADAILAEGGYAIVGK